MTKGPAKHNGSTYMITLPDNFWEYMIEYSKTDYLIRSRSDAIISLLRNAYPELKEMLNERRENVK